MMIPMRNIICQFGQENGSYDSLNHCKDRFLSYQNVKQTEGNSKMEDLSHFLFFLTNAHI